jgi:hypothetical protein
VTTTSYPQLGVVDFGKQLIATGDLDPAYLMLQQANMGDAQLARWLLAYWCTYHMGVASLASELDASSFWDMLEAIAANDGGCPVTADGRWPRNKERRHWRGAAAIASASALKAQFKKPEHVLDFLRYGAANKGSTPEGVGVVDIMRRTQTLTGFGPWIAFKVADMIDALGFAELDFSRATVFMFDNPQEAAVEAWRVGHGFAPEVKPKDKGKVIDAVVDHLIAAFAGIVCPHNKSRGIRVQEVETVLCKWKSHRSGHYGPLNDIHEAIGGLALWAEHSPTAADLLGNAETLLVEAHA